MTKQKFKRGQFVKVADEILPYTSHFDAGFIGVVQYSYAQEYGGDNYSEYCLIKLDDNGKPIDEIAWYDEELLTLYDDNIKKGLEIIEQYKYGQDNAE